MTDGTTLVATFADCLEQRDWDGLRAVLHPEVIYEVPQTRERIRGRERYITFNAEFPGDWHIEPQVILADDHHGSLLFRWTEAENDEDALAMAWFEFDGDLITKITDFWPEPYEPPPGREHLTERW